LIPKIQNEPTKNFDMAETIDLKEKISRLAQVGFLDVDIDPTLDLFAEIEKLKKEKKCHFVGALLPGS
jgi:hypothetical protein